MTTGEPKRQRNARGEGDRLKLELVEAAMRLLDRAPGTSLSLRMVAREAGIAAPSVYRQYKDAQSMMTAIVHACWHEMADAMEAATNADAISAVDRLKARMTGFVIHAMERPSRYQLLFAMQPIDPASGVDLPGPLAPAFRVIERIIAEIADEGVKLLMNDPFTSALHVISVTHGRIAVAHLAPNRPGNSAESIVEFIRGAIDHLFGSQM